MKKALTALVVVTASHSAMANNHTFPDITGYEKPYISYLKIPTASIQPLKGVDVDGNKERVGMSVDRYQLGIMRERYDNKFAYLQVFYAEGKGDTSYVTGEDHKMTQMGFMYGNGLRLSKQMEWSLFLEIGNHEMKIDGKSDNMVSAGLGMELNYTPVRWVDVGVVGILSSAYIGGGLQLKVNFK